MSETQWTYISPAPTEPVTLESMIETVEQLRKEFPDIGKCSHPELVSVQHLFPGGIGTRFTCTRCFKCIVIPPYRFVERRAKGFAETIGAAFGPAWEQKAREQNR